MQSNRPLVGIALDSGGAKGAAHIGVLDVLIENGIPIANIVGSSAGAFAGALFATGTAQKFKDIIETLTWRESLSYYVDPVFPLSGLLAGKRARTFIHDIVGDVNIEDLPIKFTAVATDLLSGETVAIDRGPLVDAIMASVAMPGIFKPVVHMERLLTDGGVTDPLPLDILKRTSPDITIAVNLHPRMPNPYSQRQKKAIISEQKKQLEQEDDLPSWVIDRISKILHSQKIIEGVTPLIKGIINKLGPESLKEIDLVNALNEQLSLSKDKLGAILENGFLLKKKPLSMNIFDIMVASTNIQQYQKNRLMLAHENPDILIEPDVTEISSLEFMRANEAVAEGRNKALAALPQIKSILDRFGE
jgi:NTE family protein